MHRGVWVGAFPLSVILAVLLSGCAGGAGGKIVSTGVDDAARATANLIRGGADDGERAAADFLLGATKDSEAYRQAATTAAESAVQNPRWTLFKSQVAAKVRVTRESPLCAPTIDLVFAEDSEDVIDALNGLAEEADARSDAQELYDDTLALIEIWENYDPADPDKSYLAAGTAVFQDFYCVG